MASERGFEGIESVNAVQLHRLAGKPRAFAEPGTKAKYPPDVPIDWTDLTLVMEVDLESRTVRGTATYEGRVRQAEVRRLRFDAAGIDIGGVHGGDGYSMTWRADGRELVIETGAPLARGTALRIAIDFETRDPQRGIYFIEPDADHPERVPHVWTQGQDEDSRFWFPCHDHPNHKQRVHLVVTVPNNLTVLSNGVLRDIYPGDEPGKRIYDWQMARPIPVYLITVCVGPFVRVSQQTEPIDIDYYVLPGREADGERAFGRTAEMVSHFEKLTGVPYPFEKYAQVAVSEFIFGGMENASMTTQTDLTLHDERAHIDFSSEPLVSHELAHQWFGDLLTCHTWAHGWLNEGFATYFELLWRDHAQGIEEFDHARLEYARKYMAEDGGRYRRSIVARDYDDPIDLFDAHLYEKGAAVLHMLRRRLGDATFFEAVRVWLERYTDSTAETDDLRRVFEETSGISLGRFFDQWVLVGRGHPELTVSSRWDADDSQVRLSVEQKQDVAEAALFELDLRVWLRLEDGSVVDRTLRVAEQRQHFFIALPSAPALVAFDPCGDLLRTLELDVGEPTLRQLLLEAPFTIAQIDAAVALAKRPVLRNVEALEEALLRPSSPGAHWTVQVEVAAALGRIGTDRCFEALRLGLALAQPKVRRAVAAALGSFHTDAAADLLASAFGGGDASYLVEAELARSLGRTRRARAFEPLRAGLVRESWNETIRIGVFDGLAALGDARALDEVAPFLAPANHLLGRCGAVRCLTSFRSEPAAALERLAPYVRDRAWRFALTMAASLEQLGDARAITVLKQVGEARDDSRIQRRVAEGIRNLREASATGKQIDGFKEDVGAVERRQRDLEERLERLVQTRNG